MAPHKTWTRDGFLISTDPSLIPLNAVNDAFASDMIYWATRLPEDVLREMIDKSVCFGLYSPTSTLPSDAAGVGMPDASEPPEASETLHEIAQRLKVGQEVTTQDSKDSASLAKRSVTPADAQFETALIGLARLVTDYTTFIYLTDVYILPEWQSQGLGEWLIGCVKEYIDTLPHLRRVMAIVGGVDAPDGKGAKALKFYERMLGLKAMTRGMVIDWRGPGNAF
jgi:GNAT superfamily N-acetyltransferase